MQKQTPNRYFNLTKKDYTKKYLRVGFTYQKLLKEVSHSFGISNRSYYAVYYSDVDGSQRYLKNRGEFEQFIAVEGADELFIEKKEEEEEEILEDSGKESEKILQNNLYISKVLEKLKRQHGESIKILADEIKKQVSQIILNKSQQVRTAYQKKIKRSLIEWPENCTFCKKGIKGVKYQCASCDHIVCEACLIDALYHDSRLTHVFIKIADKKCAIKKRYLQDRIDRKIWDSQLAGQLLRAKPSFNETIHILVSALSITRRKAIEMMQKNPNKGVGQLIDMHFN